jgi:hypothetical protein
MKDTSEKILLVVFTILTSVTEEITQGRASEFILADMSLFTHPYSEKYLKQLTRRNVVDDALRRLDKLTPVMPVTSVGMAPNISVIGESTERISTPPWFASCRCCPKLFHVQMVRKRESL